MKQVESTKYGSRYQHNWYILKALVHTDFKLRYQGSFLGVIWSVLEPLMMFCVMYVVFARFLRMSDGTRTYPVVLLLGISSWQFVTDSTNVGLRSIVDRGDMLRKVHFPNYIVVVAATMGALITYGITLILPVGTGMLGGFIRIVVAGAVGLVVAFGLCALLRVREMSIVTDLLAKVTGRLKRR